MGMQVCHAMVRFILVFTRQHAHDTRLPQNVIHSILEVVVTNADLPAVVFACPVASRSKAAALVAQALRAAVRMHCGLATAK